MHLSRLPRRTRLALTGLALGAAVLWAAGLAGTWTRVLTERDDFALLAAAVTATTICGTGWAVRVALARAVQTAHGQHEELLVRTIADLTRHGGEAPPDPLRLIR